MLSVALVTWAGLRGGFARPERPILAFVWIWPAITAIWSFSLGLPPIGGFALLAFVLCLIWRGAQNSDSAAGPAASPRPASALVGSLDQPIAQAAPKQLGV